MRSSKMKWTWVLAVAATVGGGSMGCVGGTKSSGEAERLKAYVLDAVPTDVGNSLDINFENKIHLVAFKVEPSGKVAPGADVTLTLYWRSDSKLDDGWNLFTHLVDPEGERLLNIDNVGPLREIKDGHQTLSPSVWEKGKVYVDEQKFRMPEDTKVTEVTVVAGIWKGDSRLKVVGGPTDGKNRGIIVHLKTGVEPKPPTPAHTEVPRIRALKMAKDSKITIDGKLDEEAWKVAANTGPFVDLGTGNLNTTFPVNSTAKVTWDDANMYVGFQVLDPDIVGGFKPDAKDPHLWEKDTVEMMIDPEGDGDNLDYYEIQVNPQNLVFDTRYDSYNTPQTQPNGPFGHEDWTAKLKSAVVVDGTIDSPGDKDNGYTVELALPWSSIRQTKGKAPASETEWRVNFYAMKNNGGVAWSPILGQGNFHKASRFGRVVFVTGLGTPAPVAPVPAGSAIAAVSSPIKGSSSLAREGTKGAGDGLVVKP